MERSGRGQTYRVETNLIMLIGYKLLVHREKKRHFIMQAVYSTHAPNPYGWTAVYVSDARRRRYFRPGKRHHEKGTEHTKRPSHKIIKYLRDTHMIYDVYLWWGQKPCSHLFLDGFRPA